MSSCEKGLCFSYSLRPSFRRDLAFDSSGRAGRSAQKFDPNAMIVILSSMMQENLITEAILAGAKDYIVKPFQTEEVLKVIETATEIARPTELKMFSRAG